MDAESDTLPPIDTQPTIQIEDDRTGLSIETLRRALADNLFYIKGKFSSDRSIRKYAEKIWHVQSVPVELQKYVQADDGLKVHEDG